MNKFLDGIKLGFGFIFILSVFLGIVYAVGFHSANEVLSGVFQGNYTFSGSVNFTNTDIIGLSIPLSSSNLFENRVNVSLNTLILSNTIELTGFLGDLNVNITGDGNPLLRVNEGSWTTNSTISKGDNITIRLTSLNSTVSTSTAIVSFGSNYDSVWKVTTTPVLNATGYSYIGNMIYNGGLAAAFDGEIDTLANSAVMNNDITTTRTVGIDWGSGVAANITKSTIYSGSDMTEIYGIINNGGTFSLYFEGSNDNSAWTTLESFVSINVADTNPSYSTTSNLDTSTNYRYHRWRHTSPIGNHGYVAEIVFEGTLN